MFIVALYLPWCRYLGGIRPRLHADTLKCVSRDPVVLLRAAGFSTWHVKLVGQELAPSKCVLVSTSTAVRGDMRCWIVTDESDRWSVELDVRDLGRHLDNTFRGWSATLSERVRLVIARLVLMFVLPLDFHGGLRVAWTMFLLGALHGVVASFLADASVRKLRTAMYRVVWSSRQPLASTGAVLSCLMVRLVAILPFVLFGSGFVEEVPRVYRMIGGAAEGCPGHGPARLLVESASKVGFHWDPDVLCWGRPGLPFLGNLAGPIQHFRAAVWEA